MIPYRDRIILKTNERGAEAQACADCGCSEWDNEWSRLGAVCAVVPEVADAYAVLANFKAHPLVKWAHFAGPVHAANNYVAPPSDPLAPGHDFVAPGPRSYDPNPTLQQDFLLAWHHEATATWPTFRRTKGSASVRVAVADSGLPPAAHEDLPVLPPERMFQGDTNSWGSALDYVNYGHGTMVAGIISAPHNGVGVSGVAPDCELVAFAMGAPGEGLSSIALLNSLEAAVGSFDPSHQRLIVSMSWYSLSVIEAVVELLDIIQGKSTPTVDDPYPEARRGKVLLLAAAGNDYLPISMVPIQAPQCHPDVLIVGAIAPTGQRIPYSNYGRGRDGQSVRSLAPTHIGAPWGLSTNGVRPTLLAEQDPDPFAAIPFNPYPYYWSGTGTSSACPVSAGIAALVWSANLDLTSDQVREILIWETGPCWDADTLTENPDATGIVNAYKAVCKASSLRADHADSVVPCITFSSPSWNRDSPFAVVRVENTKGYVNDTWLPYSPQSVSYRKEAGTIGVWLDGLLRIDLAAYSQAPIERIELWNGDELVHASAAPVRLVVRAGPAHEAGLTSSAADAHGGARGNLSGPTAVSLHGEAQGHAEASGGLRNLTVKAWAVGGLYAEETYTDVHFSSLTVDAVESIPVPPLDVAGGSAGAAGAVGTLGVARALSGDASGRASTTTRITAPLSAAAAGRGGASAGLSAPVSGSASGDAEGHATLTVQPPLAGGASGHAEAEATLSLKEKSAARIFALEGEGATALCGTLAWTLTAPDGTGLGFGLAPSGFYGPAVDLKGTASGHAGATAVPGVVQGLAGAAAGHAAAAGELPDQGVAGAGAGQAGAQGTITQAQPLEGAAAGAAGATATGPQLPIPLSGEAAGQASAEGHEGHVPLQAKGEGKADVTGTLTQALPLSGEAQGYASAALKPELEKSWPTITLAPRAWHHVTLASRAPEARLSRRGPHITLSRRTEE